MTTVKTALHYLTTIFYTIPKKTDTKLTVVAVVSQSVGV